ncbi:MAG: TolC family protein [candidate division WOR-3 bacterium]|nr:TolC family protein [candidate division WOR-3 bacterium]MCX7757077.1 TolC family protein [candidate division WOR-3 bacterium]MDW7987575.1 TolC family protein [candidate division WOR-3 bacterium]
MIRILLILNILISLVYAQVTKTSDTLYLTLDDALTLALHNNKALKIAQEKIKTKEAEKNLARASFFPQLTLSGAYTRLSKVQGFPLATPIYRKIPFPVYDFTGNLIGFTESIPTIIGASIETLAMGKQNNYLLRANLTQTLFSWGKLLNNYKIAQYSWELERENYRQAENNLKFQVIQAYFQGVLAREGLKLAEKSYNQMQQHLKQVEKLYKNGLASELDLLQAQVALANIKTQVIRAQNSCELAYSLLKNLIGIKEETLIALVEDVEFKPETISLDYAVNIALENRSELKNMRTTIKILERSKAISQTLTLPNLFSNFNYDYKKPYGYTTESWGSDYNITFGAQMALSLGGADYYKMKKSVHDLKQAVLSLAMLEDQIKLEVKNAYWALENELEVLKTQTENTKKAQRALNLAAEKYAHGLITNLEYINTQLQLYQAEFEKLNATINCILAQKKLLNVMGK